MSSYHLFPDPDDWADENLSEEEDEERFHDEWESARERFDPADWVNGKIDRMSLDRDDRYTLKEWFIEKVVDNDFQFPEELTEMQLAWPPDCPMSEEELRSEIKDLSEKLKALRRRAQELREVLPDGPNYNEIYEWLPSNVYCELTGAVDSLLEEQVRYAEKQLDESLTVTPDSLAFDWLSLDPSSSVKNSIRAELERRRSKEDE